MMQNAEELCAESESNKAKINARSGLETIDHSAHTLNNKEPKDKLDVTTRKTSRLQFRRL